MYEALDRTFQDIIGNSNIFGNKTVVLGGCFRQILLVIPKGTRYHVVTSTLKKSYLWKHCHVMKLTINMRLTLLHGKDAQVQRDFYEFQLAIGEGRYPTTQDN